MNFTIISENYNVILSGFWTTIWILILSLFLGLLIAIPCSLMSLSKNKLISFPAKTFSYIFRGTPLLIQLFIFYYGFGLLVSKIDGIQDSSIWSIISQAWPWAVITLMLNTAAYTSEIIIGSIKNTPKGEIESAKAIGLSEKQIMRHIVLPSALRRALPAYGNEIIYMLHGTSIISIITIMDLTGVARYLRDEYYDSYTPFISIGLVYLVITMTLVFIFKKLESKYLSHLQR